MLMQNNIFGGGGGGGGGGNFNFNLYYRQSSYWMSLRGKVAMVLDRTCCNMV
jgi:hypothetical protein